MAPFPRPLAKLEHVECLGLCPLVKLVLEHLIYVLFKLSLSIGNYGKFWLGYGLVRL